MQWRVQRIHLLFNPFIWIVISYFHVDLKILLNISMGIQHVFGSKQICSILIVEYFKHIYEIEIEIITNIHSIKLDKIIALKVLWILKSCSLMGSNFLMITHESNYFNVPVLIAVNIIIHVVDLREFMRNKYYLYLICILYSLCFIPRKASKYTSKYILSLGFSE